MWAYMAVTPAEEELRERASVFIKTEMKRAGFTYDNLIEELAKIGLHETKPGIANMLARGTFPATFFIAVMKVLGRENVNLADVWSIKLRKDIVFDKMPTGSHS